MAVGKDELVKAVGADMASILEGVNLGVQELAVALAEEMKAAEPKVYYDGKKGWQYSEPQPLHGIRQRARQDAQRLLGLFDDAGGLPQAPLHLNIFTGAEGPEPVDGGEAKVLRPELEEGED